ncbi:1,4-dihydroxy-2-naphthoate polyprenyltransferase [Fredinandcohnia quinoae]|uniref:1,4-dihydroxy-2-naphthoate octaprenyltransferase n=1 Tax=Fredinandcohnia quinoae TaxID=2918902 RepID=A0AAW5DXP5_9BACI|nr:1,4-dihydroxy-2-naphthoate polyprenyltransferase [Fredinandcohnia sp. SECRCQ15]MCH1625440.1 1,4-dihydroxy-2-naphthoate polyprenyltransferase [Fredinandcohnia sp. SECRCQ15]
MQPQIQPKHKLSNKNANDFQVWWRLMRPHTLTAAFVPVLIGTALAFLDTSIDIPLFLIMLLACLLIQAATNMINEYFDYKRGLDHAESVGIGGTIVRDGIKPKFILNLAFSFFGFATLLGVYICMNSSWWLALVGTICMAVGYLYTGGPFPIAYTPFGELASGFFMGLIIILISFFIQTGTVTSTSILVSIPIMILVGAINLSNNIRDLDGDKENGRKTLAILIGRNNAIKFLAANFIFSYVWTVVLAFTGVAPLWSLLVLLSIPKAIQATKGFIGKSEPIQMMPAMKATAQTNTIFGFLLSIGIFLSYYI